MRIYSTAPCRLSLLGGGTDVEPFCSIHGAEILNLAVNIRHHIELIPRQDDWIWIEAMGESRIHKKDKLPEPKVDPKFDLIYQTIRYYQTLSGGLPSGFQLIDRFDGIQGSGIGSSASAAVAMIGAFNKWLGAKPEKLFIAKVAQELETSLGWISGHQDQIASVYGGVNYYEGYGFPDFIQHTNELNEIWKEAIILGFTGRTRISSEIQKTLVETMKTDIGLNALLRMKELVVRGESALLHNKIKDFGRLIDETWELKKESNPATTNERMERLVAIVKECKGYAGKALGAGGEGHMIFIAEPKYRKNIVRNLESEGVKVIDWSPDFNGLEIKAI